MIVSVDRKTNRVTQSSPKLSKVINYLNEGRKSWSGSYGDWIPIINPLNWSTQGILLSLGSNSNAVRTLNYCLDALGYTVSQPINTAFDTMTDSAVKQFQQNVGISVDGKVGHTTWTAIENALAVVGMSVSGVGPTVDTGAGITSVPTTTDTLSSIPILGNILKLITGGTTTKTITTPVTGTSTTKLMEYLMIGGVSLFAMMMIIKKIKKEKEAPRLPKIITGNGAEIKPLKGYSTYSRYKR